MSRVPLQALVTARARGEAPEAIHAHFPAILLGEVYGAITYYAEHQESLDVQFAERRRLLDDLDARNRAQHEAFFDAMHERFEAARIEAHSRCGGGTGAGRVRPSAAATLSFSTGRPPRFLADENLELAIVRGVRRRRPGVVFLTAREASTLHLPDPRVLERAKDLDLIISHDSSTMRDHFADFLMRLPPSEQSPGASLVSQEEKYGIGQIMAFMVEVYDPSLHDE